jgi:hypothetical protein
LVRPDQASAAEEEVLGEPGIAAVADLELRLDPHVLVVEARCLAESKSVEEALGRPDQREVVAKQDELAVVGEQACAKILAAQAVASEPDPVAPGRRQLGGDARTLEARGRDLPAEPIAVCRAAGPAERPVDRLGVRHLKRE